MGSIVYMPKAVSVASSEANSLLVDTVRAVSYTHLDVYKRQKYN